eukprot:gene3286-4116_t
MTTHTIIGESTTNNEQALYLAKAKILPPSKENIREAGLKIKNGGLVAFPTETVYGLGANALDKDAVLSIFSAKGRPLTDPVIVHITDVEYAKTLLSLSECQTEIFNLLTSTFWPGPLTIVARASALIPPIVTAQTGFVGVRYPMHDIAQALIEASGKPIAAPSANRFGHVSPTLPIHVLDDLGHAPITILDTDTDHQQPCKIGIESTVLKLVSDDELVILRKGGISERQLRECLSNNKDIKLTAITKTVANTTSEGQEAPGQLLTHYAPDIQTFILSDIINSNSSSSSNNNIKLSECVYIDLGNQIESSIKDKCLAYRDLSESNDISVAANQLFSTLRWSESIENAKIILLPDLRRDIYNRFDHSEAVFDRIFRASSGKTATLHLDTQTIYF